MTLRLVLVSLVAALGLTIPGAPMIEGWVASTQNWMNARFADWDTRTPEVADYVIVSDYYDAGQFASCSATTDISAAKPAPSPSPTEHSEALGAVKTIPGPSKWELLPESKPGEVRSVSFSRKTTTSEPIEVAERIDPGFAERLNQTCEGVGVMPSHVLSTFSCHPRMEAITLVNYLYLGAGDKLSRLDKEVRNLTGKVVGWAASKCTVVPIRGLKTSTEDQLPREFARSDRLLPGRPCRIRHRKPGKNPGIELRAHGKLPLPLFCRRAEPSQVADRGVRSPPSGEACCRGGEGSRTKPRAAVKLVATVKPAVSVTKVAEAKPAVATKPVASATKLCSAQAGGIGEAGGVGDEAVAEAKPAAAVKPVAATKPTVAIVKARKGETCARGQAGPAVKRPIVEPCRDDLELEVAGVIPLEDGFGIFVDHPAVAKSAPKPAPRLKTAGAGEPRSRLAPVSNRGKESSSVQAAPVASVVSPRTSVPHTSPELSRAVRLTREAVFAWMNVFKGPARVTISEPKQRF